MTRWHGTFIGTLTGKNEKLARMVLMARNLANSHTLCESVNVTMKTAIYFYEMKTLRYLVIREKFE